MIFSLLFLSLISLSVSETGFVEVLLGSVEKLNTLRSLVLDRDDFESITAEHAIVHVRSPQTALDFQRAGLKVIENYPDFTRINALKAQEESANYVDQPGAEPNWTVYCDYNCTTTRLNDLAKICPSIFSFQSIGKSNQNRSIWVARITKAGSSGLDQVFLAGNIHGDEPVGGQLLQHWLWDACNKYGVDPILTTIVDNTDLYIMPMFNPDGYEARTRGNANGVDLNRDFPNTWTSNNDTTVGRQVETGAYMNFTKGKQFKLSCMYHGGAIVANYPYDGIQPGTSGYSATDRDGLVTQLALIYSKENTDMYNNKAFPPQGIVNGAMWYVIYGSAQDFQYDYRRTIDVTIEVSNTKWPAGAQLPSFYTMNYKSINAYVQAVSLIK